MVGLYFDAMIAALSYKEWLQRPIKIQVIESVLSHSKSLGVSGSRVAFLNFFCPILFKILIPLSTLLNYATFFFFQSDFQRFLMNAKQNEKSEN